MKTKNKIKLEEKQELIKQQIIEICDLMLDDSYKELCLKVQQELIETDKNIFNKGSVENWSTSIVWAVGYENFLFDKTFEPYASLADLTEIYGTKLSTIGQKAGKIRKLLDMSYINDVYQLPEIQNINPLNNFFMTEEGFIVDKSFFEFEDEFEIESEGEILKDDGYVQTFYFRGVSKVLKDRSVFLQFEYFLNKMVKDWGKKDNQEKEIKVGLIDNTIIEIEVTCLLSELDEMASWLSHKGIELD